MTVKEARIILLCNNIVELFFAQSKGVFSKETLDLDNDEENIDLDILKQEALPIILAELEKQDTEINSLKETIQKQEKSREHLKKQLKGEIAVKDTEINKLKQENNTLKEQLQMFIPRRRVRRIYKMLGKILRTDIDPILLEKELKSEERRGEYE